MRIYKPIDGLLPEHRRQRRKAIWIAIPAAILGIVVLYFMIVGGEVAQERRAEEEARLLPSRVIGRASGLLDAARRHAQQPERAAPPAAPVAAAPVAAPPVAAPKAPPREIALAPAEPLVEPPSPEPEVELPPDPAVAALEPAEAPSPATPEPVAGEGEAAAPPVDGPPPAEAPLGDGYEGQIKPGQTIYDALVAHQLSPRQIQSAINALGKSVDFRRSRVGDHYRARIDPEGNVVELAYKARPEVTFIARRQGDSWSVQEKKTPLEIRHEHLGGTVRSSLYAALRDLNASAGLISKFIDIFSYDFNFAGETKPGDTFRLVYEKVFADGRYLRTGEVVAAEYVGKEKSLRVYYDKETGTWYDGKGQSLKRLFLLNPVTNARMTSQFGKRMHPILKRWMMHNGVDFAAPTGTPVKAIAGGKVTFAGRKGANGNLVAVQHSNGMTSFYAHLQGFASNLKAGQEVKQGDVIGFVGSTGRSTGPHLHLAVQASGKFVDPLSVKSTRKAGLTGQPLRRFQGAVKVYDKLLSDVPISPPSSGPPEPELTGGDDLGESPEDASVKDQEGAH
jgi:murein DD-endopeptidase MepM/ murein hydrolase activator NlpD